MDKLIYASASELARAIRAEEVSSEEVIEAHLQRIEEVNPKLNAVVQLTAEAARAQAREAAAALKRGEIKGPLHGVPMTIKDNLETADVICTAGTKGRASYVPTEDATVVKRLRDAGAILLGKTNLPEMALAWETDNLVYGCTNNPYDLSRTPGGSSGGEAAIICSGGSPFGIGNDMAGSIRLPAHFSGIAGIKPTFGRVPITGFFPPSTGRIAALWQNGPLARFVDDLILTLPIIAGVDWRDPSVIPMPLGDPKNVDLKSLRIAFHTDNGIVSPTPETDEVVRKTANILSDTGMTIEEARPEGIEQSIGMFFEILSAGGDVEMRGLLERIGTTEVHPWLQGALERWTEITVPELGVLNFKWLKYRSSMLSFMKNYDAILCPVNAFPAMLHGTSWTPDKIISFSYTAAYNLTGWPGAVVRAGTSPEGLPIGVQVVARPWREDVALAVVKYIEDVLGGWKPPPI